MWKIIKNIFKTILEFIFYREKVYLDWLSDKNTTPVFKLKDEDESRFGEGIQNESSENAKNEN